MSTVADRNPWVVEHVEPVLAAIDEYGPMTTDDLAEVLKISPGGSALVVEHCIRLGVVGYHADGFHRIDPPDPRPEFLALADSDDPAPARADWG